MNTGKARRKEHLKELNMELFDLTAKVIYLIKEFPGWSDNDTFTFPDGDTWHRFDPDPQKDGPNAPGRLLPDEHITGDIPNG